MNQVSIDNQVYDLDTLSHNARQMIANIQAADVELQRLQVQQALATTARSAYLSVLRSELPSATQQPN